MQANLTARQRAICSKVEQGQRLSDGELNVLYAVPFADRSRLSMLGFAARKAGYPTIAALRGAQASQAAVQR